jgi:uncharacterized spore protein YtfJ
MVDNNLKEDLEMVFGKLENFLKTKTVVGEPIKVGEATLVPFITVSFGCGGGNGTGKDDKNMEGGGSGLGACAKVVPNAVLVIKGDDIKMLPIKNRGGLENLMKMVPDIVKKFTPDGKKQDEAEEEKEE